MRTALLFTLALAASAFAVGCDCGQAGHLATLARRAGTVEGDVERSGFRRAALGDRFGLGDAVRTGARSTADLEMTRGTGLRLAERTTVRFARGPGERSAMRLAVETGQVEVETAAEELWIDTDLGAVRIDPSSRVQLRGGGAGMRVEVVTGAALLDRAEGPDEHLVATSAAAPDAGPVASSPRTPDAAPAEPAAGGRGIAVELRAGDGAIREAGQEAFQSLAPGSTRVGAGALLRLQGGAQASVRRGGEEATLTGPTEVVLGPSATSLLRAERGAPAAVATRSDVRLEVPGGVIVLRSGGTRARVAVGPTTTEITPLQGTVAIDARQDVDVAPGQVAVLARDGGVQVSGAAGGVADLSIAAGESPVIHDPAGATAVRVRFGESCPGLGTLEVTGGRRIAPASGTSSAVVRLRNGVWQYQVRCAAADGGAGEVRSRGTITVRGDSGAAPLARRVAHNSLDADGRNYTVLYQNLLPTLTFRWSDAPPTSGFTLHLAPQRGGARALSSATASHTFASGEVAEGNYQFWFQSSSGVRSPTSRLHLGFDNAAPAATIRDIAGAPDGSLRVQGLVEPGWSVTVDGQAVPLDGHNRFSAELAPAREGGAAALRLEKAGRGVHYYLRRRPVATSTE